MRFRTLAGLGAAALVAACADGRPLTSPVATQNRPSADFAPGRGEIAVGHYSLSVGPEVFGVTVDSRFSFVARKDAAGNVAGKFAYEESDGGAPYLVYSGHFTCMNVYDFDGLTGNRAKVGGEVDASTDPTIPAGTFIWWQSIDDSERGNGLPDQSTFAGFGDATANTAFCNSAANPKFGPFVADGNFEVNSR